HVDGIGADGHEHVLLRLDERERPACRVAVEDGERVVQLTGGIDVPAVRAYGESRRPVETGDIPGTVPLGLEEPEVDGCGRSGSRLEEPRAEPCGRDQQEEVL